MKLGHSASSCSFGLRTLEPVLWDHLAPRQDGPGMPTAGPMEELHAQVPSTVSSLLSAQLTTLPFSPGIQRRHPTASLSRVPVSLREKGEVSEAVLGVR